MVLFICPLLSKITQKLQNRLPSNLVERMWYGSRKKTLILDAHLNKRVDPGILILCNINSVYVGSKCASACTQTLLSLATDSGWQVHRVEGPVVPGVDLIIASESFPCRERSTNQFTWSGFFYLSFFSHSLTPNTFNLIHQMDPCPLVIGR